MRLSTVVGVLLTISVAAMLMVIGATMVLSRGEAVIAAELDTYRDEKLFERAAELAPHWEDAIHALRDAPHVIDIRNLGLIGGIELEPRPGAATQRALEAFRKCFDAGVLVRVTGDIIAFSPPLIVEKAQIDRIVETVRAALRQIA